MDEVNRGALESEKAERNMVRPVFTLSVVSHGQARLIEQLLADLARYCRSVRMEVVLTINIPEPLTFQSSEYPFEIQLIENPTPKGFAANHNAAFRVARGEIFCVINPDIRLQANPFDVLASLLEDKTVGVVAPAIVSSAGRLEISARKFPSPLLILKKALQIDNKQADYEVGTKEIYPDWVGGMFMLFRSGLYKEIGGFNESYFLYYEDVDICARLTLRGYKIMLSPQARVIHDAQRTSHRKLKYLKWHLSSMMRFFLSRTYWLINWRRLMHRD